MRVAIINYGMGNLASVQKVLNFIQVPNIITTKKDEISASDCIILPGVGSFFQAMKNIKELELDTILTNEVISKKKKFLGICLGMQLIFENGTEPLPCKGLGWLKGNVKKFDNLNLRIPHMGWNDIKITNDKFFKRLTSKDFYFIHSYHVVPEDKKIIAATVDYGKEIVASVIKDNIFATQFHPEKSQTAGLFLLKEFFNSA